MSPVSYDIVYSAKVQMGLTACGTSFHWAPGVQGRSEPLSFGGDDYDHQDVLAMQEASGLSCSILWGVSPGGRGREGGQGAGAEASCE